VECGAKSKSRNPKAESCSGLRGKGVAVPTQSAGQPKERHHPKARARGLDGWNVERQFDHAW
jgi:hypothetical protein